MDRLNIFIYACIFDYRGCMHDYKCRIIIASINVNFRFSCTNKCDDITKISYRTSSLSFGIIMVLSNSEIFRKTLFYSVNFKD